MKKRIVSIIVGLFFLAPYSLMAVSVTAPEDLASPSPIVTVDFQLSSKLRSLMEPFMNEELSKELSLKTPEERAQLEVLKNAFLEGRRIFISFSMPNTVLATLPVSAEEWTVLMSGLEKETYDSIDIYKDDMTYFARIGEYAVMAYGPTVDSMKQAIDLANGKSTASLSRNTAYTQFANLHFSPRILSMTMNLKELTSVVKSMLDQQTECTGAACPTTEAPETASVKNLLNTMGMFEFEGFSFGEVPTGYKFNVNVKGNEQALREQNYSLNAGGSFTPNLYKKFPNAKPIFYAEFFNFKANYEQSEKMLTEYIKAYQQFMPGKEIEKALGIKAKDVLDILGQEIAFGIQYEDSSPLPYLTLMANVSNKRETAQKIVNALTATIEKELKKDKTNAIKLVKDNGMTVLIVDITKLEENYSGPPFAKISFSFGITADNLLIFSNYPGINDASKRTGFAGDSDFLSFPEINEQVTGITYFNARNVWTWLDFLMEWTTEISDGQNAPPLDVYQDYYTALEKIYTWRDLFIVNKATETASSVTGTVTLDKAKHKTYKQFLKELRAADSDNDGVSDYEELYVYHTPINSQGGSSEIDSLKKGLDPKTGDKMFKDVAEDQYYTDETAFLAQRGCISGYADRSFQPGRLVNRAEFTAMVVKCFESGASNFLGVDMQLRASPQPFADVQKGEWYSTPVSKAYSAGFVSGGRDPLTGNFIFRPGDSITRAEAIAILNKASGALLQTRPQADTECTSTPFSDVKQDDWFCGAVANAYNNKVTSGKAPDSFKPFDNLTRAEAAVMIQRTLEKDIEYFAKGTRSLKDTTSPLLKQSLNKAGLNKAD